jgi:hypothetical protein
MHSREHRGPKVLDPKGPAIRSRFRSFFGMAERQAALRHRYTRLALGATSHFRCFPAALVGTIIFALPRASLGDPDEPAVGPNAVATPPPLPPRPIAGDARGAAGLRADLDRIVSGEETTGWFLDRAHYEAMHSSVVQSVCRATPEARQYLHDELGAELAQIGDPRALFEAAGGKMTSDVERALHVSRMRTALGRAMAGNDCPFWVKPEKGYDGRQTDRNRFTLNLETGGLAQFRYAASQVTLGAGPSIRILAGLGFGHTSILAGAEFAGGPMIREDDSSKLVLNYFPAIPIVVRIRDVSWTFSFGTGVVSLLQGNNTDLSYGIRAGFGIGLMALRTRWFIPWAGIAAFYEHYFPGGGRPAAEFLRGGFRIGIIYDP